MPIFHLSIEELGHRLIPYLLIIKVLHQRLIKLRLVPFFAVVTHQSEQLDVHVSGRLVGAAEYKELVQEVEEAAFRELVVLSEEFFDSVFVDDVLLTPFDLLFVLLQRRLAHRFLLHVPEVGDNRLRVLVKLQLTTFSLCEICIIEAVMSIEVI